MEADSDAILKAIEENRQHMNRITTVPVGDALQGLSTDRSGLHITYGLLRIAEAIEGLTQVLEGRA